jgi:DNA-binding winged helix-turn-helix (wHTH) protein/Flp pilus assembly protein TadD
MTSTREFELGDLRVVPARGVVIRDGHETRLEPKQMDLLLLFAGSASRVIGKDEIIAAVWEGRAIGDDTLAAAISRLRAALGESASRRFIETLPKRGYRLLVAPSLAGTERSGTRDTAANLVAKGRDALRIPLGPSLAQARAYFEGAIRADARNAEAQAGLADALLTQLMVGQNSDASLASMAKAASQASVVIDDSLAPGWSALGFATLIADRDFAAADLALSRAIALAPTLASARSRRAYALATIGKFVEAEREARHAIEIEPLSFAARTGLTQLLLSARQFARTIVEAKRALEISAQSFEAWFALGWAHAFLGAEPEAVQAMRQGMKHMGADAATTARLDAAFAEGGLSAMCRATADLFEAQRVLFVPRPMDIAMLRALSGQPDEAFSALDLAASRDDPVLLMLPWLPYLDRIRNDPRFAALRERVRLVR